MTAPTAARLAAAEAEVARLRIETERATARANANTVPEMAAVSGIRRKPNPRADARRYVAYGREAEAFTRLAEAEARVVYLSRLVEREAHDAQTRAAITPERLAAATDVRTRWGWETVVRVNAKSVTVAENWPMDPRRVPLADVLEVRP